MSSSEYLVPAHRVEQQMFLELVQNLSGLRSYVQEVIKGSKSEAITAFRNDYGNLSEDDLDSMRRDLSYEENLSTFIHKSVAPKDDNKANPSYADILSADPTSPTYTSAIIQPNEADKSHLNYLASVIGLLSQGRAMDDSSNFEIQNIMAGFEKSASGGGSLTSSASTLPTLLQDTMNGTPNGGGKTPCQKLFHNTGIDALFSIPNGILEEGYGIMNKANLQMENEEGRDEDRKGPYSNQNSSNDNSGYNNDQSAYLSLPTTDSLGFTQAPPTPADTNRDLISDLDFSDSSGGCIDFTAEYSSTAYYQGPNHQGKDSNGKSYKVFDEDSSGYLIRKHFHNVKYAAVRADYCKGKSGFQDFHGIQNTRYIREYYKNLGYCVPNGEDISPVINICSSGNPLAPHYSADYERAYSDIIIKQRIREEVEDFERKASAKAEKRGNSEQNTTMSNNLQTEKDVLNLETEKELLTTLKTMEEGDSVIFSLGNTQLSSLRGMSFMFHLGRCFKNLDVGKNSRNPVLLCSCFQKNITDTNQTIEMLQSYTEIMSDTQGRYASKSAASPATELLGLSPVHLPVALTGAKFVSYMTQRYGSQLDAFYHNKAQEIHGLHHKVLSLAPYTYLHNAQKARGNTVYSLVLGGTIADATTDLAFTDGPRDINRTQLGKAVNTGKETVAVDYWDDENGNDAMNMDDFSNKNDNENTDGKDNLTNNNHHNLTMESFKMNSRDINNNTTSSSNNNSSGPDVSDPNKRPPSVSRNHRGELFF